MVSTCIVVADAGVARIYVLEPAGASGMNALLVERVALANDLDLRSRGESATGKVRTETNSDRGFGPMHPIGEHRERHRVELERRFGVEIARHAGEVTRHWTSGVVVFAAEPRFLGLARESLRQVLPRNIELKEIARDYVHLAPSELYDHLARNGLMPAPRS